MLIASRNSAEQLKPYDAEVEYLQGDGSAWIDSGIVGTNRVAIDVKWSYASTSANTTQWGARATTNSAGIMTAGQTAYASDTFLYPMFGEYFGSYNNQQAVASSTWECFLSNGAQRLYKNGTLVWQGSHTVGNFSTVNKIPLLAIWNTSTQFLNRTGGRIWLCKIWEDGNLVRDLVPVRVGSGANAVGYMYDRVSEALFGNAGSGRFEIGPDKSRSN